VVVDNDRRIKDLAVNTLTYCVNREVKSFDSAGTAWDYIVRGGEVDIVLSNVDLPEMDGFELMSRVKGRYPDKIFILMSGVVDNEKKARLAGADAFLAKPFEINHLFSIVQDFVVN
jgi:DNA-binding NtrC family response regulator